MTLDRTENWWNPRLCTAWCSSVRTGLLGNNKNIYHAIKPQHEMPLSVWVCICLKGRNVFPLTHKPHFCLALEIDFLSLPTLLLLIISLTIFSKMTQYWKHFFNYMYRCTNVKYQITISITLNYFRYHTWNKNKKRAWIWLLLPLLVKQNYGPFLKARTLWAKINVKSPFLILNQCFIVLYNF